MLAFFNGYGQNVSCSQGDQDPPVETPPRPDYVFVNNITVQSYQPQDPNEIVGLDGYDELGSTDTLRWVSATQTLAYTVYFENDAELAMAAASKVAFSAPLNKKNIRQI